MKTKKTIIIFIHYYLPGYESGGPVKSIANIVKHLGDEFDFRIITLGWDLKNKTPYPHVRFDEWNNVEKAKVWYYGKTITSIPKLFLELRRLNNASIYLNSLFDPIFTFLPLLAIKLKLIHPSRLIVAPRGELSPGAIELKREKKRSYLRLVKTIGLLRNVVWHASTQIESTDIKFNIGNGQAIFNACDLSDLPKPFCNPLSTNSLVFISRITPKKNLAYALSTLKQVSSTIDFHIYGTVEDVTYWQECQQIISGLPKNVTVFFHGPLNPELVTLNLQKHSLFFFPTRGENYGHVIAEALCAGLPVLLSDQTPWNDAEKHGAGWIRKLDDQSEFAKAIDRFFSLSKEEKEAINENVRLYAEEKLFSKKDIDDNRLLFLN